MVVLPTEPVIAITGKENCSLHFDASESNAAQGSSTYKRFLKGRGVKKGSNVGDLMITLDVRIPQRVDGEAKRAIEEFAKATIDFNPRAELFNKAKL